MRKTTGPPSEESCVPQTLGLVGLHIGHKVQSAPQWVWFTFEHVDNDPGEAAVRQAGQGQPGLAHYSFYDPDCTDCEVNEPPPRTPR